MRYFILACILTVSVSCSKQDPQEQLKYLNGYWEIKTVQQPNKKEKHYSFNESIDYINLRDSTGFRTKLKPRLDGSYIKTGDSEKITVKIEHDSLHLYYSTLYDNWKETVLYIDNKYLKIKNQDGVIYTYTPYEPLDLD